MGFLLFLAGSLIPEKNVSTFCFLCFLVFFFFLSCLNPVLAVLYALGISSPLAVSRDPNSALLQWFFFHLLIWTSFLFFLFLHKLWGSYFMVFWASSLLGLPPLFFFNFIFHGPLCYSFGPKCCDFLDLNTVFIHGSNLG